MFVKNCENMILICGHYNPDTGKCHDLEEPRKVNTYHCRHLCYHGAGRDLIPYCLAYCKKTPECDGCIYFIEVDRETEIDETVDIAFEDKGYAADKAAPLLFHVVFDEPTV